MKDPAIQIAIGVFIQQGGFQLLRLRSRYFAFIWLLINHGRKATANEFIIAQSLHYAHCLFWFFFGTKLIYHKLFALAPFNWAVLLMTADVLVLLVFVRWAIRNPA